MNPNPTTPKTVRSVLEELGAKAFPHEIDQALAAITQIEEECAPEEIEPMIEHFDAGFNSAIDEYKRNLEARRG